MFCKFCTPFAITKIFKINFYYQRFGFKRTVPDEDSLHGKQDTNTSKENNTNKPLFHEQNITQTSVPDFTVIIVLSIKELELF